MSADQRPRTLGTVTWVLCFIAFVWSFDERIGPLPAGILLGVSLVFLRMAPSPPLPVRMNRSLIQRRAGVVLTFTGWLVFCGGYEMTIEAPDLLPGLYNYIVYYIALAIVIVGMLLADTRSFALGAVWPKRGFRPNEHEAQLRLRAFAVSGRILAVMLSITALFLCWNHVHQVYRNPTLPSVVFVWLGVMAVFLPGAIVAWIERELPLSDSRPELLSGPDGRRSASSLTRSPSSASATRAIKSPSVRGGGA